MKPLPQHIHSRTSVIRNLGGAIQISPGYSSHGLSNLFRAQTVAMVFVVVGLLLPTAKALGQGTAETQESSRAKAFQFYRQGKYLEALPLLEKLAVDDPSSASIQTMLGSCLLSHSATLTDSEAQKKERIRARSVLLEAQKLGDRSSLTQVLLDETHPDGSSSPFSARKDVDDAMQEGEAAFAKGDVDGARAAYSRALLLDPTQYYAALFIGDAYFKAKELDKAGEWFARAIEIGPQHETAYRYWADALLLQGKTGEAREKYIRAVVAEPYSRASWLGLANWTRKMNVKLTSPQIPSPPQMKDKNGDPVLAIDIKSLENNDGTISWLRYEVTRQAWKNGLFAKSFPAEKTYRHSLAEEAAALQEVAESVSKYMKEGKIHNLDTGLAALEKLNDENLIEAYVLISRADAGIAMDYPAYHQAHADKLRHYLEEYVVPAE